MSWPPWAVSPADPGDEEEEVMYDSSDYGDPPHGYDPLDPYDKEYDVP